MSLLCLAAAGLARAAPPTFENMNGEYLTSSTPHAPEGQTFNTKWDEYPGGTVDFFEAYM